MRRPSLRSNRAFFIACNTIASHSFLLLRCKRIAVQRKAYTCRYGLRFSLRCPCRVPTGTQHTPKTTSLQEYVSQICFLTSIVFSFLRPMATSHQAAVCCFFVFACAKVITHSIANARTGTPCLSINLHAIRVVFTRSNSCIHSVITLFFAHQKSKTDCDADGSDQKKTQIQWKQTKISTPAQLQDANIFQTPHAKRGKILNPLKSWFH